MIIVNKLKPRGIIWIASYPRSGNTWTRAFIHALVGVMSDPGFGEIDINRIESLSASESASEQYRKHLGKPAFRATQAEIAKARPLVQADIAATAGRPVFIKTHNAHLVDHGMPMINMAASAGAIYVVRNPLDVAISFAHLRGVPVDTIIADMATRGFGSAGTRDTVHILTGSWTEHVRSWTDRTHPAVLIVKYEDMFANPTETFGAIARHLIIQPGPEQLAKAIDLSRFERLRAGEDRTGFAEKPATSDAPFFREGRPGQWREQLTGEQVERVVAAHGPVMKRFGYLPE